MKYGLCLVSESKCLMKWMKCLIYIWEPLVLTCHTNYCAYQLMVKKRVQETPAVLWLLLSRFLKMQSVIRFQFCKMLLIFALNIQSNYTSLSCSWSTCVDCTVHLVIHIFSGSIHLAVYLSVWQWKYWTLFTLSMLRWIKLLYFYWLMGFSMEKHGSYIL